MRFSFGQSQTQKQTQTMAPRMIQSMEILQMAQAALEEKIETELIENPALERVVENQPAEEESKNKLDGETEQKDVEQKELIVEEGSGGEDDFERLLNLDNDIPDHFDGSRPSSNRVQESMDRRHDFIANIVDDSGSLQTHLLDQLHDLDLDPKLMKMCERIISSLSAQDGGYLKISLSDLLPLDATPEDSDRVEEALAHVQGFDPKGIGARDLVECLLLQLSPSLKHVQNVRKLIVDHLDDLHHNRLPAIEKATGMSMDQIDEAWGELKTLDPRPARRFFGDFVPKVNPDMWLERDGDKYVVKMEEGPARNLHISNYYRKRLANGQATADEKEFIKRKIASAQWLIESIEQRRSTVLRVAQEVVTYQQDFFDIGPEAIKPLKMEQIAEKVGVAVTTISRAVGDKYVETHRGILPLRMFFVHGTTTDDGEEIAWGKIGIELKKLVDAENKGKPLSDEELMKQLGAKGFPVARRTIAKYREKLGIPSSRGRKVWSKKK